ncbi:hypothetical protein F5884DRAFT_744972 [Xylogone sp. PMI_703]|nr:hypothetical protein F5884DRAFT_744972 [Xylogone sp. PMI_703]
MATYKTVTICGHKPNSKLIFPSPKPSSPQASLSRPSPATSQRQTHPNPQPQPQTSAPSKQTTPAPSSPSSPIKTTPATAPGPHRRAVAAGVKRFIPSDFAFNSASVETMSEMERMVPELARSFNCETLKSKLSSGLKGDSRTLLGISIPQTSAVIIDSGNEPYMTTARAQIACVIIRVLQSPGSTANQYLSITSFITTQNQLAEPAVGEPRESYGGLIELEG